MMRCEFWPEQAVMLVIRTGLVELIWSFVSFYQGTVIRQSSVYTVISRVQQLQTVQYNVSYWKSIKNFAVIHNTEVVGGGGVRVGSEHL